LLGAAAAPAPGVGSGAATEDAGALARRGSSTRSVTAAVCALLYRTVRHANTIAANAAVNITAATSGLRERATDEFRRRVPAAGSSRTGLIVNVRAPSPPTGTRHSPIRSSSASACPMRARRGSSHARSAPRPSVPSRRDASTPARAATSAAVGRDFGSRARHARIKAQTGSDVPRRRAAASRALPLSSEFTGAFAPPPSSASSVAPSA